MTPSRMVQAIRYLVVLLTGFIAGSRIVGAAQSWMEWQRWSALDPSSAGAYRQSFLENTAVALLSLTIAALVWWLLRPRAGSR
ncbi:MAG TPA: hypothetical protein VFB61_03650 [Gemmatimonadales bacterium]|nr:hypothetical protein [Gemmatimonadales bacterium]